MFIGLIKLNDRYLPRISYIFGYVLWIFRRKKLVPKWQGQCFHEFKTVKIKTYINIKTMEKLSSNLRKAVTI